MKITSILAIGGQDAYVLTGVFIDESEKTVTVSTNQDPISDVGSANLMSWIRASYENPIPPDPVFHIKQVAQYNTLLSYHELKEPVLLECDFENLDDYHITLKIKYKSILLHC